jgi:hypothetical protein
MAGIHKISLFARLVSVPDNESFWKLDQRNPKRLVSEDKKGFSFDKVLFSTDNNSVVYNVVGKASVKALLDGYNSGIVCYGMAESGKFCDFLFS